MNFFFFFFFSNRQPLAYLPTTKHKCLVWFQRKIRRKQIKTTSKNYHSTVLKKLQFFFFLVHQQQNSLFFCVLHSSNSQQFIKYERSRTAVSAFEKNFRIKQNQKSTGILTRKGNYLRTEINLI